MFICQTVRLLSTTFGCTSGEERHVGKQRQQQQQQQQQQERETHPPSRKHLIQTLRVDAGGCSSSSFSANFKPACAPNSASASPLPRGCTPTHLPPATHLSTALTAPRRDKVEAELPGDTRPSASATTVSTPKTTSGSITVLNNHNNSNPLFLQPVYHSEFQVSASPADEATLVVQPADLTDVKISRCQTLTYNSAENDSTSNFPFRPLHLQTLTPSTDHNQIVNTTVEGTYLTSPIIYPPIIPTSNEPDTAMQRKLWVRRPGASATRVEVNEDDLVDNVRDVILHKYANSLGRHIDSPDITLKIVSREQGNKNVASERVLGPEESIGRTLDTYYPGGQTIEEALVIEVPQKRTPKPSPRPGNHHVPYYIPEDYRPGDSARDYFPPMPLQSPHVGHVPHPAGPNGALPVHSMSILTTGQAPALPSPGGHNRPQRHIRPKYPRQHTSSPTIVHSAQPNGIDGKTQMNGVVAPAQPLPPPSPAAGDKNTTQPPNRTTSPHPRQPRKKRQLTARGDMNGEPPLPSKPASAGLLDGKVPPINVLLVEDNVINLKLLEQVMKRLKVRYKSAMNGKEAVSMWREGGFHLVLMDIQLPVMNGLQATKEIRRLEGVNGIGLSIFGDVTHDGKSNGNGQLAAEDKLQDRKLFKSPVIIVALTASSLQSDRHEALASGCNDFLTKPVNFVWMERKVTEWGCMQALIDFDGWRRWKAIAENRLSEDPEKRKQEEREEKAKAKAALKAMFSRPPPTTRKENSNEAAGKKDESSTSQTSPSGDNNTNNTEQSQNRRNHRGSKSQGGNAGIGLGTTLEVEEKDA